jgi:cytochrome c oxidase assembly factor CtaG
VLASVLFAGPAAAHAGHEHAWTGPAWTLDPWVLALLGLSGLIYSAGVRRLWSRAGFDRGIRLWQVLCFATGWLAAAAALVSPLHALGEVLFSAHMVEHEVLMVVAAPLFVLARPLGAAVWAMPTAWRSPVAEFGCTIASVWRAATDPLVATILHGTALWFWHMPAMFDAALASEPLHRLQHMSFFVTALCFWQAGLNPRSRTAGIGLACFCLFATALHSGFLGILLTFAPGPLYAYPGEPPSGWGLTTLEDQQIAGLTMWVPGGLIYAAAAVVLIGGWIHKSGLDAYRPDTHPVGGK